MNQSTKRHAHQVLFVFAGAILLFVSGAGAATNHVVVGWNNLGMHCLDSDFSVFSILPPYNTINAQLIMSTNGYARIVTNYPVSTVTYQAVADADGSINTTSIGKGNFWQYVQPIFGLNPPPDAGLAVQWPEPFSMPGITNQPQAMGFEASMSWYVAYGIPVVPYDDQGKPNFYPMMRLAARIGNGPVITTADTVLPLSDEMDCKRCHLSVSTADAGDPRSAAKPAAGWVFHPNPGVDYRLNILRLHDEREGTNLTYMAALATNGFNAAGLYVMATVDKRPALCASCHLSEAIPGSGLSSLGVKPLTAAVHGHHAAVVDPRNGMTLDASRNRIACYACHPGSVTRCLRGAMGKAVAADGTMAMQCQDCHGTMFVVGATNRVGWLNEPNCQACHTGDAVTNSGAIRFLSAYTTNGQWRVPANTRFATNPDTPLPGYSLYRFSRGGHGSMACAACHGSTHAEYPSAYRNDNVQSQNLQGHPGMLVECDKCHGMMPRTTSGGPHGLHPLGQTWVDAHHGDAVDRTGCRACHGASYTGTVLSRAQATRTMDARGAVTFFRGQQIGCYDCHNGAAGFEFGGPRVRPTILNVATGTAAGVSVAMILSPSTGTVRIVSQPANGTVGLSGIVATYYPGQGFTGTDTFTYVANSGYRDSTLAVGTVLVTNSFGLGDAIPDWWRVLNFGSVTNADAALNADPDGDQFSNLQEFKAGTDPYDPRSNLRIFEIQGSGANAGISFVSLLGTRYNIERTADLRSGSWTNVVTNVWGHTDVTVFSDSNAPPAMRFYRIVVP